MNQPILQQIIQSCISNNMNNQQIQLTICKLAIYLNNDHKAKYNKSQIDDSNVSKQFKNEWKEQLLNETERFQEIIGRKFVQVVKIENKIGGFCDEIININKKIEENQNFHFQNSKKLKNNIQNFTKIIQKLQSNFKNQIQKLNYEIEYLVEYQLKNINKNNHQNLQKGQVQFYKQQKWSQLFNFDGKTLIRLQNTQNPFQFMFFEKVDFHKFSFKIKIVKSKYKFILIGVVDYEKQKQQQFSSTSNNAVCYSAYGGYKFPGYINDGIGINVGETVEVIVDRQNSIIRWIVENQQRASFSHALLGDVERNLRPYVEMSNIGDTIEFSL